MFTSNLNDKKRYLNGLISYIIIFFFVNIIVSQLIQTSFISYYNLDIDIFKEIISSTDYSYYLSDIFLDTQYYYTTTIILKMSSIINLITYIILLITFIFIYLKDFKNDFDVFTQIDVVENKSSNFIKTCGKWLLIYYFFNYLIGVVTLILNNLFKIDSSQNQIIIELALKYSAIPMIISAGLIGPLVEELIFRKSIFGLFENKKIALVVSTISFSVIHILSSIGMGYNLIQLLVMLIPYVSAGALFGFIYIKTNYNIYYVTLIHMFSNLLAITLLLLS